MGQAEPPWQHENQATQKETIQLQLAEDLHPTGSFSVELLTFLQYNWAIWAMQTLLAIF